MVCLRPAYSIRVVSIDSPRGEPVTISTRILRLLPRETCLEVEASFSGGSLEEEICFEPLAEHSYELTIGRREETDIAQDRFFYYGLIIRDTATARIVAYTGAPGEVERSEPPPPQPVIRVVPGLL